MPSLDDDLSAMKSSKEAVVKKKKIDGDVAQSFDASSIISKVGSANMFANSQEGKETEVGHLAVRHKIETSNGDESTVK